MRGALEECGHEVTLGLDLVQSGGINLFFDRFFINQGLVDVMSEHQIPFGLVCTEVIGKDGTWNYGAEKEGENALEGYRAATMAAKFVWCLLEESVEAVHQWNARAVYCPMGYVEAAEPKARRSDIKDCDFVFTGVWTRRRSQVVDEMRAAGLRVITPCGPVPDFLRDAILGRARANVTIQKTPDHTLLSVTRLCHSIIHRSVSVVEYNGPESAYTRYCIATPSANLISTCVEVASRSDLTALANQTYAAFREEMPMRRTMKGVLEATVG
jgi:hypothetical protein